MLHLLPHPLTVSLMVMCLICALVPMVNAEPTRAQANAELEQVRGRIEGLRKEIEDDGRRRSRAEKALAKVEQEEQKARRELAQTRKQLDATRTRQGELEQQLIRQESDLETERAALGQQLRVAYINGSEEWMRVALSQQDPSSLGRRMAYYGYMSRQRSSTIANLRLLLLELEKTRKYIEREARDLLKLESDTSNQLEEIADTRGERARLVAKINKDIASKDTEINRLQAQAKDLSELVAALARVLPAMPNVDAEPFAGQTSQLRWPVKGKVIKRFGQSRADGRLKWQGVLLDAPAGSNVRAVYHGRVVFSDWLDGMGLLIIIEHGDGYMSLYGHNQDLLKEVGDWVAPDETVAHVGDSGGRAAAGLYFEIRKNGEPVNPGKWMH
ncbi:MAG: peptidoglycan DD-metalloendopeptidase family protein [Gammaproteobacteria bacterium]|nr:peptidoglycan DD-metalloendopeptidase family protein [Gammaproteobacteria bacterium]MCP4090912.1 peptidoglycan DD-metalloendopeptidase family protein [Gammaproteobacteria bacterium]MCP4830791.1 peptidoglycan DD-metalloendopeptidase family protein [Gammaproteobacteria bacterium]MCP4929580.1 peptidoglycan DD-metalloendopeptidase family protein [Gammaproteobacteria bacterium]